MKSTRIRTYPPRRVAGIVAALLLAATLYGQESRPQRAGNAPAELTATAAEQVDVAVTVYNANLALVRDVREIELPAATGSSPWQVELRWMDIAATVNPATVHLSAAADTAGGAGRINVLEQNYEYDLLSPERLLQKYIGREVILARRTVAADGSSRTEEVRARLLALNQGPVWQIGNEIVTGLVPDHYRFPEVPENLYSRPTLVWKLESEAARRSGRRRMEASYLASDMNWRADYVLTVARDDKSADLHGWVTLTNNSGAAYRNARLQLVAGDLNIVRDIARRDARELMRVQAAAVAEPAFEREAIGEYHLYSLARRTSIHERETKQISLLTGSAVPIEKHLVVDGEAYYYRGALQPGQPLRDPVKVQYRFRNDERSNLGMPMPAGIVRVYQADARGSLQFMGEDRIAHTPRNENLTIYVGNAFDVVAERKQTDFRRLSDRLFESEYEITIRNQKDSNITVEVNEPVGGDWEMIRSSHEPEKTSAFSVRFRVPVEKEGTAVLRYRVRVRY
jgi:hypothetical protein